MVIQLLTLASGPLVARLLGPEGRGELATAMAVAVLVSVVSAGGIPTAIAYTIGRTGATARDALGRQLWRWGRRALIAAPAALIGVGLFLHQSDDKFAIAVVTPAVAVLGSWQLILAGMLRGEGDVRRINFQAFVGLAVYVACIVVCFGLDLSVGPATLLVLFCCCVMVALSVGWSMLRRPSETPKSEIEEVELRRLSRRSFLGTLGGGETLGLDLLIVALVLGPVAAGFYAVARSLASVALLLLNAVAITIMPRLASLTGARRAHLERRALTVGILMAASSAVGLAAVSNPLIPLLFGDDFLPAVASARLLSVGLAITGVRRLLAGIVQARGHASVTSYIEGGSGVLLVVGIVIGSLSHGLTGAAAVVPAVSLLGCVGFVAVLLRDGRPLMRRNRIG